MSTVDATVRNAVVIGSGPSGYTAAIYLARAALEPLVFEGSVTAGGALMNTTDVENHPGFPNGVLGPQLMEDLRAQAERFGAELVTDDVSEVDLLSDPEVVVSGGTRYHDRDRHARHGLGVPQPRHPRRDPAVGTRRELVRHLRRLLLPRPGLVVGGGDTAVEEATFLTRSACSVTIVHRRDTLRAGKVVQQRAFSNDKIRFVWDERGAGGRRQRPARGGPPAQPRHRVTGQERSWR